MADWWPDPLMGLGAPGILKYIPSEHPGETLGVLETSRFTSKSPHFKIIGSSVTTYAASRTQLPDTSTRLWRERQVQERWLSKSRPEIAMGNTAFQDILREDMEELRISNEAPNTRPLLAIGHSPDPSDKSGVKKIPIMAVASGEAGEILRLARMEDAQWQWGANGDAFLNAAVVDSTDKAAEATWADDGLPIRQVVFAGGRLQDESTRWLLVQKETKTTVLWPEFRQVPTASTQSANDFAQERPSLINPHPLFTIYSHQTGGSAHSDAALITAASGRSQQIAIIDETGYWSIWDLPAAWQSQRKGPSRLSLTKCGHISDGLLDEMPSTSSHPNERHGILIVEGKGPEKIESSPSPSYRERVNNATQYLLMWNHEKVEVLNLDANILLPRLGRIIRDRGKLDWILDVHRSPVRQDHVFILTQYHITWVDLLSRGESGSGLLKPSILLSCPHLGTKHDDSRMFICRASDDDEDTSLVFIYYPRMGQLCIYWFTFSPVSRMPQWHRDIISLPGSEDREFPSKNLIEFLRVDPVQLAVSVREGASSPGIDYYQRGVRFYQLSFLGKDLSLQRCLCVTSDDRALEIQAPTSSVAWADVRRQKQKGKRRRTAMAHVTSSFVLPDEITAEDVEALLNGQEVEDINGQDDDGSISVGPRPVYAKLDRIYQALQDSLHVSISQGEGGLPSQLFDALRQCLNDGYDEGRLRLMTWNEVVDVRLPHPAYEAADDPMREEMESLLDENDERVVVTQLRRFHAGEDSMSLVSLQYSQRLFAEIWLDPVKGAISEDMQRVRRIWAAELARETFLSSYGIMFQNIPLLGPASSEVAEEENHDFRAKSLTSSSQITAPSRSSSRDVGSSPASSPAASAVSPDADGAIQRLRLLAQSLDTDKLDSFKRSKILSYWPNERGVDPNDYVSSLARANEELFRDAKERLERKEAKRKAQAEKFKRPAFMRQGLPEINPIAPMRPQPMQTMSSQVAPAATQTQLPSMAMSQPMPGAFGDRKKKKKRKHGF
ncbi:RNA polymerase I-specific transcription initiation factor RRN6-like protein [Trichoderma austrokoningii]